MTEMSAHGYPRFTTQEWTQAAERVGMAPQMMAARSAWAAVYTRFAPRLRAMQADWAKNEKRYEITDRVGELAFYRRYFPEFVQFEADYDAAWDAVMACRRCIWQAMQMEVAA